ncbi:hypothetical protein [Thalassobellus suaedae]|uniref:Nucleotide-diphospho-sugar transferase domain-containing protein n=1 Tax=Thalassobellus suaedae TaxID=3074124 RepID=A0ABY9Y189_9FLAO|nr:hypothetical protein RHP49_12030 [Flavobacteriaceae bacterium HL-DH10]
MKNIICTIITANYVHYALALHDSFLRFDSETEYCIFISSGEIDKTLKEIVLSRGILIYYTKDFRGNNLAQELEEKYSVTNQDAYRWGMKSILILKLLEKGYNKVIYVDCDICFFNRFDFLWDELELNNILLSPHWRCSNPKIDLKNFRHNFLDGIFNGGFIGATKGGTAALTYWAELCLHNCEVNRDAGYYVDQRYLDILPTRFDNVGHITHKGCNVANWNIVDCKRVLQKDGNVLINNSEAIIFIHFTNSLFKGAYVWNDDTLLIPYIELYRDIVLKYHNKDIIQDFFENGIKIQSRKEQEIFVKKKHTLLLKMKKMMYNKLKQIKHKLFLL